MKVATAFVIVEHFDNGDKRMTTRTKADLVFAAVGLVVAILAALSQGGLGMGMLVIFGAICGAAIVAAITSTFLDELLRRDQDQA